MSAIAHNHIDVVLSLLIGGSKERAASVTVIDAEGRSPLSLAVEHKHVSHPLIYPLCDNPLILTILDLTANDSHRNWKTCTTYDIT
jgi:hypothetical protein